MGIIQRNLPNILTLFRIVLIPVLVIGYYLPYGHVTAPAVFFVACVTDGFDGYFARSMNLSSRLGAFLDPVADKLLIVVALVIVLEHIPYLAIPAAVIIGREIVISALREWMAELGKRTTVAVNYIAKVKTVLQMFALGFLLASQPDKHRWIIDSAYVFTYLAASLTLWTMFVYIRISWKELRGNI